jgi:hypothetical protein
MTYLNRLYQILNVPFLWIFLFGCAVVVLLQTSLQLKHENNRLRNNQEALLNGLKRIELANGTIAHEQSVLTLQMRELNKQYPNVAQEMKALGIAKRKLVQFTQTGIQSKLQIETTLRDSFSKNPLARTIDTIPYRLFQYQDNYYSIEGRSFQDKQWLNISNRDTLVQIVYRERKRKWLWIFSPFIYRQRIQCKNPNASIHYAQIIQIQK